MHLLERALSSERPVPHTSDISRCAKHYGCAGARGWAPHLEALVLHEMIVGEAVHGKHLGAHGVVDAPAHFWARE